MKALAFFALVILSPAIAQFLADLIPATPLFMLIAFALMFIGIRFVIKEATK